MGLWDKVNEGRVKVNHYQKDEAKAKLEAQKKELAAKIAKSHSPSGQRHSFDRAYHNAQLNK